MTMTALGTALSASIGLNVVLGRKIVQQGGMLTKLAAASALLNEKLIERLSLQRTASLQKHSSDSSPTPISST
jgi:hypothetical protein